ncbi:hypothetical protein A5764_15780 [Mycobacterium sp. 852002-51057_SCH5723018]|nr:hypothetical protein A5764_15780 [Mycobacterium sp. 852002-51057_SCH5723018]
MAADTSSLAAAATPVVGAKAAAWASLTHEPMLATLPAAAASMSGAAITYDMTASSAIQRLWVSKPGSMILQYRFFQLLMNFI